jgi:hypothetical protein
MVVPSAHLSSSCAGVRCRPQAISHQLYSGKFALMADGRRLIAPGIRIDSSEFLAYIQLLSDNERLMSMRLRRLAVVTCLVTLNLPVGAQQRALFDFHSGFWVNLHHYLHAHARSGSALAEPLPDAATSEDRQQWRAAIESYRTRYGRRSLLFDEELVRLNSRLASAGNAPSLADAGVADADRSALEAAAPVYRRLKWPEHDRANQQFIAALAPLLKQHGDAIANRLAASFDATWPTTPIPVDIVHDAGPPGNAYTISEPTHINIGASDPRHQGLARLELIFHEASHRWDEVLMREVDDAAKRLGTKASRDLWHALLFFNAGTITADALTASGTSYRMYAVEQRVFGAPDSASWSAIGTHWPMFLAGKISRVAAIERILAPR